jgi:microsomal prostaglandin-E synthase 2
MTTVKLYEFSLCPFCNKVRAGLELKGVPFESVEVSPRSKVELPPLPEGTPKKVPVLQYGNDTVADSTAIL